VLTAEEVLCSPVSWKGFDLIQAASLHCFSSYSVGVM
jgi:hypothetical protein